MTMSLELTSLLAFVESGQASGIEYVVGGTGLNASDRESAAQLLADDAMSIACGISPVLESWRHRRDGGPASTASRQSAIATYAGIGFGAPSKPPNEQHLQGHIAELLWNRLVQERTSCRDGRQLVRAHSVKADPLEPGGDGLVVYQDTQDRLVFRLWEIKKHDAKRLVSSTINRASKQLANRGHEYLAKLAGPETIVDHGLLSQLYASMVELWLERSARAGVGVAIGTSQHHAPKSDRTFGSIKTAFPEFVESAQTESIVIAVPDFPGFAKRVKEIVWSGL